MALHGLTLSYRQMDNGGRDNWAMGNVETKIRDQMIILPWWPSGYRLGPRSGIIFLPCYISEYRKGMFVGEETRHVCE